MTYARAMTPALAQCLLLAKVIVADGMITDDERVFLNAAIARHRLTSEERARVVELEGIEEAHGVVATLSDDDKREFLESLMTAASADGRLSAHDMSAIKKISAALGID